MYVLLPASLNLRRIRGRSSGTSIEAYSIGAVARPDVAIQGLVKRVR